MEWRVVLDTMIWVSAGLNEKGAPGAILRLATARELRLVTSPWIHEEILATFPEVKRYWARARRSHERAPSPPAAAGGGPG